MNKWIVITLSIGFLALSYMGIWLFRHTSYYGSACEAIGGRWGFAQGSCITRSCYKDKNCGMWVNPGDKCHALKIGDPISEVYFQLGEPHKVIESGLFWTSYKMEDEIIIAHIENERLASIECNINITSRSSGTAQKRVAALR